VETLSYAPVGAVDAPDRRSQARPGRQQHRRVVGASGRTITFADGSELDVDAVIWATGYRSDYSWIEPPVLVTDGRVQHRRGVTDVPGLYFLGLSWQHTRGSALIGWVKDDAEFIANQIERAREDALATSGDARASRPTLAVPSTRS
jgi:putative flavoprotein involved in K+ transport